MQCGLFGRHLGHSYSPQIHALLGSYPYALYEREPEDLAAFLRDGDFTGINVTIPYKKDVIPHLAALSPQASALGAVNTIVRSSDGKLAGHNTDYFGFHYMLRHSGLEVTGKKVLVLGTGGAANTVVAVLRELGARTVSISRSGEDNYTNLTKHADASVIVNATPVGMYPHNGTSPVSLDIFPALEGVLDLIYNPARTALLQQAEAKGIVAENGLWMLVAQAKESAEWFTGTQIDDSVIPYIHRQLSRQMENIVLIGMPGCGKSTVGALLARELGRQFIDADAQIVQDAGCSIPDIFTKGGEDAFRRLETQTLTQLGKASGLVIATGGGCVTRPENYPLLHQNGRIVWLQRELELLPKEGRPLSQSGSLAKMYAQREPMYRKFADRSVPNSGTPEDAAAAVLQAIKEETQ